MPKNFHQVLITGAAFALAASLLNAPLGHADPNDGCTFGPRSINGKCPDEYGSALDIECRMKWIGNGQGARMPKGCLDEFLWQAQTAGLKAPASRKWDEAMYSAGIMACLYEATYGTGDIGKAAEVVRNIVPSLEGGQVFPAAKDSPAENLVWIAQGSLCADGVTVLGPY